MPFTLSGNDACQHTLPTPITNPYWVAFSPSVAQLIDIEIGSDGLPMNGDWLEVLAGNQLRAGKHDFSAPISTAYSGQPGVGRATLSGRVARLCLYSQPLQILKPQVRKGEV